MRAYEPGAPAQTDVSLAETIARGLERTGRSAALILDQFETYLLQWEQDEALGEELAEAFVRTRALSVVFAVREESLAKSDRLETQLAGLFRRVLRLEYLTREQAREALEKVREAWNARVPDAEAFAYEPRLLDTVLAGVPAARTTPGRDLIETAHLQLVMQRLWDVEAERGSRILRRATLDDLRGPQGIVHDHVWSALEALTAKEQKLAAVVLDRLVTPTGERLAQRTVDLARYANVGEPEIGALIEKLSTARILRPADGGREDRLWELYHDVLADAALAWRQKFVAERRLRRRYRLALLFAAAFAVGFLVVGGLATYAWLQRQTARSQAFTAEALALLDTDPQAAVARALRAFDTKETAATEAALRATLAQSFTREVFRAQSMVHSVAFTPSGILAGADDGTVRLWPRRRPVFRAQDAVLEAVPCPDAERVAVAGDEGARLVEPGRQIVLVEGARALGIACSSDGTVIAVATDTETRVFDGSGKRVAAFPYPGMEPAETGVAVSRDGTHIAAVGSTGGVVWLREGGATVRTLSVPREASSSELESIAFSPDGSRVVTGGADGNVRVWPLRGRGHDVLQGHSGEVRGVTYSSDGGLIASAAADRTIRIWDGTTRDPLETLHGHSAAVTSVAFAASDAFLASGSEDGTIRRWENPIRAILRGHTGSVSAVSFGPNGRLVTAADGESALVWSVGSRRRPQALTHGEGVRDAVAAAGSGVIVTLGSNGKARIWRSADDREPLDLPESVTAAAVSADGAKVLYAVGRELRLIDPSTGRKRVLVRTRSDIRGLALAPSGARAAVASLTGPIRIVDVETRRDLASLLTGAATLDVAFSGDGTMVLAAGDDGTARIWDTDEGGRPEATLPGHEGPVMTIGTSADSRLAVTADLGGTVRIWDIRTRRQIRTLRGWAAAFSPDDRLIGAAGPGPTVRIYGCEFCGPPGALRDRADTRSR